MLHNTCPRVRLSLRTKIGRTSSKPVFSCRKSPAAGSRVHSLAAHALGGDIGHDHVTARQLQRLLDRRLLALDDQRTSLQAQLDQFCQLVTRQPGLELAQSGRGLATGRGRDFLVASVELASQLGQLVLEPLPLPFGFGLVEAQP